MNNILSRAVSLLLIVQAACVSAAQINEWNANRVRDLQTRASFDLKCPQDQLAVTSLTTGEELVRIAGVDGCGRRGTYLFNAYQGAWIMDAASTTRSAAEAAKERPAD